MIDPVASFRLANDARLERINVFADNSEDRRRDSFGVMVNYVYGPDQVERNHERFVTDAQIMLSRSLLRELRLVKASFAESGSRRFRA